MKNKNIFGYIGLMLIMGLTLMACTQDEQDIFGDQSHKTANGFYVYPVNFDCAVSGYDDEGTTRAMSYEWSDKTSLFARFKSGSNTYMGFLTYENKEWSLVATEDFFSASSSGTVELYYFKESNGDNYYMNLNTGSFDIYNNGSLVKNTSLAWNAESFDFSEGTAVYITLSATYSLSASTKTFSVNASLVPALWRLRFKGSNGTSITMPGSDNDIMYLSAFNWFASNGISFSGGARDINLKVSNGYTPYVYGEFAGESNRITVRNGNDTFTRNISSADLKAGKSGYFTLPTSSNYSSYGWTKVVNNVSMDLKSMLEKPLGIVNVNMKTASFETVKTEVEKTYKISAFDDGFFLYASSNPALSSMTYHDLPFYSWYVVKGDNGIRFIYTYSIKKSQASYNYMSYFNKILDDFKSLNISLTKRDNTDYLVDYAGYDADKNYHSAYVTDDGDTYEFKIYASYDNASNVSSDKMELKTILEKPLGTVNVNMKTASYETIKKEVTKLYKIDEYDADGRPFFSLYVSDNPACSNMTYHELPFSRFSLFKDDNGVSFFYHFIIKKSQASYNYTSYFNKILDDLKNMNIMMTKSEGTDYLLDYYGYDAAWNYYSVDVSDEDDVYDFSVYVSYKNTSSAPRLTSPDPSMNRIIMAEQMKKEREMVRRAYKK